MRERAFSMRSSCGRRRCSAPQLLDERRQAGRRGGRPARTGPKAPPVDDRVADHGVGAAVGSEEYVVANRSGQRSKVTVVLQLSDGSAIRCPLKRFRRRRAGRRHRLDRPKGCRPARCFGPAARWSGSGAVAVRPSSGSCSGGSPASPTQEEGEREHECRCQRHAQAAGRMKAATRGRASKGHDYLLFGPPRQYGSDRATRTPGPDHDRSFLSAARGTAWAPPPPTVPAASARFPISSPPRRPQPAPRDSPPFPAPADRPPARTPGTRTHRPPPPRRRRPGTCLRAGRQAKRMGRAHSFSCDFMSLPSAAAAAPMRSEPLAALPRNTTRAARTGRRLAASAERVDAPRTPRYPCCMTSAANADAAEPPPITRLLQLAAEGDRAPSTRSMPRSTPT